MFNLIITVVSILLVGLLAYVGMSYISSPADKAREQAKIAQFMSESEQLRGGTEMYMQDHSGAKPATLDELVNKGYLNQLPDGSALSSGAGWQKVGDAYVLPDLSEELCAKINEKATGSSVIKKCDDPTLERSACCSDMP